MKAVRATLVRRLKRPVFRGTIIGLVVAGHLALALLVLVPPAPRLMAFAVVRTRRRTALRVTLIRAPLSAPEVPQTQRPQPPAAPVLPLRGAHRHPHPQREITEAGEHARSVRKIMGELLESPRGLVHLVGRSKAPVRYTAPLATELRRLANGRLALRLPNLPGAPCFILPQHFKNPNHHGLHLIALAIAEVITPPRLLPYVMKQISIPDSQPVACHPLPTEFNRVFNLPAEDLLAPGDAPVQPDAQGPHRPPVVRSSQTMPSKSSVRFHRRDRHLSRHPS